MNNLFSIMLRLQEEMNQKINPNWRQNNNAWHRAIWIECAELLNHYGWKWWKKEIPNPDQTQLEIVDIWHFGISLLLQNEPNHACISLHLTDLYYQVLARPNEIEWSQLIEEIAIEALSHEAFPVKLFFNMMLSANLPLEKLYRLYVSKNVLNRFRQDNGYSQGQYFKNWNGVEDNEHLIEILNNTHATGEELISNLYDGLRQKYANYASLEPAN